jgi:hypothetical protein
MVPSKKITELNILKGLLTIHSVITLGASLVLIIAPTLIPGTVNIALSPDQYLLCYFLAAAEIGIAYLSFFARKIDDRRSLQVICSTFIVFHISTAGLELLALTQGLNTNIISNVILRIIISFLFWYYGIYKIKR